MSMQNMNQHCRWMLLGFALAAASAAAQTTVTTSGGTTNTVPVYTGSATIGNSPITVSGSVVTVSGVPVGEGGGSVASNIAIGVAALSANTTGAYNFAAGYNSLKGNTSGSYNFAAGYNSLSSNTTGGYNFAAGYGSLLDNTTGSDNLAIGYDALPLNTTGANNVALGYLSGFDGMGAYNDNTFVGSGIGYGNGSAVSNNTVVGFQAGYNLQGNGNVMIGNAAGYNYLGSNAFFLGNVQQSSVANDEAYSLLYGTFAGTAGTTSGQSLTINGTLGIGKPAVSTYPLAVNGQVSASGYCIGSNCITTWPTGGGGSGTVTSITAGAGLNGGTITGTGTISLNLANANAWTGAQTFQGTTSFPSGVWNTSGNVGIGTTTPGHELEVYGGGITSNQSSGQPWGIGVETGSGWGPWARQYAFFSTDGTQLGGLMATGASGDSLGRMSLGQGLNAAGAEGTEWLNILSNGNVGIGTTSPGASLEVNGNVKLTANSGASIIFQDGTTQTTAYTGVTCGGDYAESVDVTGDRTKYGPGDVLVLDPDNAGKILKSAEAYSTSVSGIYSTKPGTVGRRQTTAKSPDEVPMAVVGIVPAKVSTENGPIKVGDLLVTSSTPGYAMKGTDRSRMLGAIVGKAMANLNSGKGVIEVLVTLQ